MLWVSLVTSVRMVLVRVCPALGVTLEVTQTALPVFPAYSYKRWSVVIPCSAACFDPFAEMDTSRNNCRAFMADDRPWLGIFLAEQTLRNIQT